MVNRFRPEQGQTTEDALAELHDEYDLRVDNPSNPNVRGFQRSEIRALFPHLSEATLRSTTLVPPLIRMLAGRARLAAELLEAIPPLRTHYVGVFVKGER